ncbi:MAG: L-histidine N(alpha)-methyltransferase, partial [Gemmatimonadales bacterium]
EPSRVIVRNLLDEQGSPFELAADARRGLTSHPKTMPPKYLYDDRGSELFERITGVPEYYQTRTERGILQRVAPLVVDRVRPTVLIEFGSGSAFKTRVLLEEMRRAGRLEGYGMLDVSESASRTAAAALIRDYPRLSIECVITDFEHSQPLPFRGSRRLLAFLGSTIGNFELDAAHEFLGGVAARLQHEDAFLIGFDLVKEREDLLRAYDDAAGITAAFNLNLLRVLNRELDADFDLDAFEHRVRYDESHARIEMHLVSRRTQVVRLGALDLVVEFAKGETICTELSHKYTRRSVEALLEEAGLVLDLWETDPDGRFALCLARKR